MGAEHFAAAAAWRRLLDDYYSSLVGDDPTVEPKRPVRPADDDVEIEPINPSGFTGGNPNAGSTEPVAPERPGSELQAPATRLDPATTSKSEAAQPFAQGQSPRSADPSQNADDDSTNLVLLHPVDETAPNSLVGPPPEDEPAVATPEDSASDGQEDGHEPGSG